MLSDHINAKHGIHEGINMLLLLSLLLDNLINRRLRRACMKQVCYPFSEQIDVVF
jgi:hypothetical protein